MYFVFWGNFALDSTQVTIPLQLHIGYSMIPVWISSSSAMKITSLNNNRSIVYTNKLPFHFLVSDFCTNKLRVCGIPLVDHFHSYNWKIVRGCLQKSHFHFGRILTEFPKSNKCKICKIKKCKPLYKLSWLFKNIFLPIDDMFLSVFVISRSDGKIQNYDTDKTQNDKQR